MRWLRGQGGQHGLHTECGSICRWVASLVHRQVLEQGRGQKVNVRHRPLVNQQANRKIHTDPELSLQPDERASRRRMRIKSCFHQYEAQKST